MQKIGVKKILANRKGEMNVWIPFSFPKTDVFTNSKMKCRIHDLYKWLPAGKNRNIRTPARDTCESIHLDPTHIDGCLHLDPAHSSSSSPTFIFFLFQWKWKWCLVYTSGPSPVSFLFIQVREKVKVWKTVNSSPSQTVNSSPTLRP